MKVLWFSNTPANGDTYLNLELRETGGWLKSLDCVIQTKVELHVAFYSSNSENFKYKNTFYHPIKINNSLIAKIIRTIFRRFTEDFDLNEYLAIIRLVNPDIIHIHGTEGPFLCILRKTNIPIVISIQGNLTVITHKYFDGLEKEYLNIKKFNFNSISGILFPYSFKRGYLRFIQRQIIEERNLRDAKYIMGRTRWDFRISRILAPASSYFLEDRILRSSFYCNVWKPHNCRHISIIHTTIGNIFYKGFETLCLALFELNRIGFCCEWRVAGISEDDLIVKITKRKLGRNYPVHGLKFLGKLNEKELLSALIYADMYVMTSHIENNVNSLCEAMIIGMPCISTFVGGVGSLIIDEEEGVLIQSGDPWAMSGAILELSMDKHKGYRLGLNARIKALIRHDKERISTSIVDNYSKIIQIENSSDPNK
ncbi:MAG: glycosyltransferase family 4 protein [Sphingobacteriia bacterium]|nr:glycosyltransferase family 4 protein [Sphingobacteriia bacterium]